MSGLKHSGVLHNSYNICPKFSIFVPPSEQHALLLQGQIFNLLCLRKFDLFQLPQNEKHAYPWTFSMPNIQFSIPRHPFQSSDRFGILHGARRWYCHALGKISKRSGGGAIGCGRTGPRGIWVWDGLRTGVPYSTRPQDKGRGDNHRWVFNGINSQLDWMSYTESPNACFRFDVQHYG